MQNPIIIMGPTASGKTKLALELANYLPIEIISVDSALIYTDMNIGTAKPTTIELSQVPHHLINIISPLNSYSVAEFVKNSVNIAKNIILRDKIPLFVGGTMMYFNALINGLSVLPESQKGVRDKLENELAIHGLEYLYTRLGEVDEAVTQKIQANDTQRIIRALEVYEISGVPMSILQDAYKPIVQHNFTFSGYRILAENRQDLHHRINQRFTTMLEQGLVEEVKNIRAKYPDLTIENTAMRSVGYKQAWQYLDQDISYNELLEQGMASTRQLAKRQLTWLNNMNFANNTKVYDLRMEDSLELNLSKILSSVNN